MESIETKVPHSGLSFAPNNGTKKLSELKMIMGESIRSGNAAGRYSAPYTTWIICSEKCAKITAKGKVKIEEYLNAFLKASDRHSPSS